MATNRTWLAVVLAILATVGHVHATGGDISRAACGVGGEPASAFETVAIVGVVSANKEARRFLPDGRRDTNHAEKIRLGDLPLPGTGLRNSRGLVCLRTADGEAVWIRGSSVIIDCKVAQDALAGSASGAGNMGLGTGSCAR